MPGFSGNGKKAEVGGPRDGGEGGDGHVRHLQLPRQQRQHQELAAIVEQPEVSLTNLVGFVIIVADLEVEQSICPPVEDMCCPKHHKDVLPNPRRLLNVISRIFYSIIRTHPKQECQTQEKNKRPCARLTLLKWKTKGSPDITPNSVPPSAFFFTNVFFEVFIFLGMRNNILDPE